MKRPSPRAPLICTNSPAVTVAACPTRVVSSRWPRALIRSTQNPLSKLWNVTRSTRPAKASVSTGRAYSPHSSPLPGIGQAVLFLAGTCRSAEIGVRQGSSNTVRQTTELSRVKARIKALAEKTVSNGCTEADAMAAAVWG